MRKFFSLFLVAILSLALFASCGQDDTDGPVPTYTTFGIVTYSDAEAFIDNGIFSTFNKYKSAFAPCDYTATDVLDITDSDINIDKAGVYRITGTTDSNRIIVDLTPSDTLEEVVLILDSVSIITDGNPHRKAIIYSEGCDLLMI